MPINVDHWKSMLIISSRHWWALKVILDQCLDLDQYWLALGIVRGSPEICIYQWAFFNSLLLVRKPGPWTLQIRIKFFFQWILLYQRVHLRIPADAIWWSLNSKEKNFGCVCDLNPRNDVWLSDHMLEILLKCAFTWYVVQDTWWYRSSFIWYLNST